MASSVLRGRLELYTHASSITLYRLKNAMSERPLINDKPATRKPGDSPAARVDGPGSDTARKKAPLAREPSDVDPTRYGDWEKNGRCIDF
jgi:hypothetical protein